MLTEFIFPEITISPPPTGDIDSMSEKNVDIKKLFFFTRLLLLTQKFIYFPQCVKCNILQK